MVPAPTPTPLTFPFKAVMFDLDGVLVDTTELHYRVWSEFAQSKGVIPTQDQILATNGRLAEENILHLLGSHLTAEQVAEFTSQREMYFNSLLQSEPVSAVPGAVEYVHELINSRITVGVATSAIPENARTALARVNLSNAFQNIITAADVNKGKPDPEPYQKLADTLGYPASDCIVIEDSVSGIRAAKAAGAKCLALATTFPETILAAENPDWLIKDFTHLPPELHPQQN